MSNSQQEVDPINMGSTYAPLNSSCVNLSLSTTNSGTSGRHTLTVAAAATITLDTTCRTIEFIPSVTPTSPIFIKFKQAGAQTDASATNFDEVITESKSFIQVWVMSYTTTYSIYSAVSQTVFTIER